MSKPNTTESIFRLMHALKCNIGHELESQNLGLVPMQMRVLMMIHKRPNCTANDIVQAIRRDKAQITRLIAGLIDQQLIRKEPNPNDKRSQLLVFTDEGHRLQSLLLKQLDAMQKKITSGLSEQEVELFEAVSAKMAKNLELSV